jgi:hypothetical protein
MEWRTDVKTYTRDGLTWQAWTQWCLTWRFCWFGKETIYLDGPHDIWKFGIACLYRGGASNLREMIAKDCDRCQACGHKTNDVRCATNPICKKALSQESSS